MGTTTAAAIIIRRTRRRIKNPQQGRPQQRRRFFDFSDDCTALGEGSYGEGHDGGRVGVPPRTGVAIPGGGKAASIPESPDLRFSSSDTAIVRTVNMKVDGVLTARFLRQVNITREII